MVEKIKHKQEEIEEKDLQFKLKANELKYKILIDNLPQKIFLKDKNSVYVSCNNNFAQDLGIKPDSIAGKTDYDFFPKELAEKYRDDDRRIILLGETEDLEETYIYNGKNVYVHTVKTPIKDENGIIIGILGIFRGTTEQHKIYEKFVDSEHNLLERVKELTCIYELSTLFENPKNTIEDIIRGILTLIPPTWKFPTITCARIIYDKKEFKEDEFRESKWKLSTKIEVNKKDLEIEVFYLEDKPFLDEEVYLLNDIGNRLKNFIEKKETEQKFRFLFETSPDPIFLMDLNGILKDCNREGEKKFGYTKEELIGKPFMKFSWFLPETMPLVLKTFKTLVSGKIPEPLELQQRRKDGTLVWVNVLYSFMAIGEEKLIQVITQDISKIKEAEQMLRESEEKFRTMTSSAQDAIIQVNHVGDIVFWNKAAENMFGYSSEEVLSRNISFIIPERYRKTYRRKMVETMKAPKNNSKGRIINVEGLRKDGTEFPTELSFSFFLIKGKRNSVSIVRNITERVLYEKHLQQTHNQLDQIFNASIPMYVTDVDFNIIKANERFGNKFQVDVNEIIGMKCYDIWKGKLCNTDDCSLKMIKRGVDQYEYEIEKKLDNDSIVNYFVKNYPYHNHNNTLIGCIKTFTDITKRIKIEKNLRESEAKYRNVLENIKEGYYEVDIAGNFTLINDGLCEIFGYMKEELIESHYSKLYDKKNLDIVFNVYNSLFKAGEGFSIFDCEAIKKNGEEIFVESSVYLKHKEDGKKMGFKGFLRNVTEKKQAEALEKEFNEILEKEVLNRTNELNKALEQQKLYLDQIIRASNFKTKFLATMSHELRTPLNAMIGFTDLLLESKYGAINEEQTGFLQDIKNSAEHQYEMIKHILDISKIESGQVSLKIEEIHLQNLIRQIISSLNPLYREKKLIIKLKGITKNSRIFADRIKFKQIIYNLLSNALKFTEKGKVILEFKDNIGDWEFNVKDTGIGIAEKDYDKIFKDFKRIKSPYVDSTPGSGLGLALTRRIINLHEGEITFISKIGVGTTFRFTIPKYIQELNNNKRGNKSYKA